MTARARLASLARVRFHAALDARTRYHALGFDAPDDCPELRDWIAADEAMRRVLRVLWNCQRLNRGEVAS